MYQLAKNIQSSGIEYNDAALTKYRKRRFGNYGSTGSTFLTYEGGFFGLKCDGDNNYYSVNYTRFDSSTLGNSGSSNYGFTVEKFNNGDLNDRAWSYAYYANPSSNNLNYYPQEMAISQFGKVLIVGRELTNDRGFVCFLDTNGNVEVFDTLATGLSTRDVNLWDCYIYGSDFDGDVSSREDGLSFTVFGDNTYWGYGGSPWSSYTIFRYGFGTAANNYLNQGRDDTTFSNSGSSNIRLMGNSLTNRYGKIGDLGEPNLKSNNVFVNASTNFYAMSDEGNGTVGYYTKLVSLHYSYGYNYRYRRFDFKDVHSATSSSYKVLNGSNVGNVAINDFKYTYTGSSGSYFIANLGFYTKSSGNLSKHDTVGVCAINNNSSLTFEWFKTWQCYNDSGAIQNNGFATKGLIPLGPRNLYNSPPYNIADGIAIPYSISSYELGIMILGMDGSVEDHLTVTNASGSGEILNTNITGDKYGNLILSYYLDGVSSQNFNHLKIPNPLYYNFTNAVSYDDGNSNYDVEIQRTSPPSIVDQISNVSYFTGSRLSYGTPSASYAFNRYNHHTDTFRFTNASPNDRKTLSPSFNM